MISIVIGILFILVGGWGLWYMLPEFLVVLKGTVPMMLVLGGLLSIIAGASTFKHEPPSDSSVEKPEE